MKYFYYYNSMGTGNPENLFANIFAMKQDYVILKNTVCKEFYDQFETFS